MRTMHVSLAAAGALVLVVALGLGACQKSSEQSKAGESAATAPTPATSQSTSSTYSVEGDVVHVNNQKCAVTGTMMAKQDLGKFESRVTYDGPIEKFKGKTLVFNQCCDMCIQKFPSKWANERDQIMKEHGLM